MADTKEKSLLETLVYVIGIAEQRGDRLEDEGVQLSDMEEAVLSTARTLVALVQGNVAWAKEQLDK
jgi:hypothetical protein